MADLLLLGVKALAKTNLAVREESSKEAFTESGNSQGTKTTKWVFWSLYMVIVIMIGSFSAYLSWTSNSLVYGSSAMHLLLKSIFALFAFLFGLTYLFFYMIFKWDLVSKLSDLSELSERSNPMYAASPSPYTVPLRSSNTRAVPVNTRTSLFSTPTAPAATNAAPRGPNAAPQFAFR